MAKLTDKLMRWIGLVPMTNREVLMDALDALPDEAFAKLLLDHPDLEARIQKMVSSECSSPCGSGACSRFAVAEWLKRTWTGATLIISTSTIPDEQKACK